jgi:hypothetical protein
MPAPTSRTAMVPVAFLKMLFNDWLIMTFPLLCYGSHAWKQAPIFSAATGYILLVQVSRLL